MKISMVMVSKDGNKFKVGLTAANDDDLVTVDVLVNTTSQAFTLAKQLFDAEVQTFDEIPDIEMKIEPEGSGPYPYEDIESIGQKLTMPMGYVVRNYHNWKARE